MRGEDELYNNLAQQPEWIEDSTGKITGYKTSGGADTVFPFKHGIYIDKLSATGLNGYGAEVGLYFNVFDYKKLKIGSIYNDSGRNGNAGGGNNTSISVYGCNDSRYLNLTQIYSYGKIIINNSEPLIPNGIDISNYNYIKILLSAIPSGTGVEGGIRDIEIN